VHGFGSAQWQPAGVVGLFQFGGHADESTTLAESVATASAGTALSFAITDSSLEDPPSTIGWVAGTSPSAADASTKPCAQLAEKIRMWFRQRRR
jgi:glutathione S-transferase